MRWILAALLCAMPVASVAANPLTAALDSEVASGRALIADGDLEGAVVLLKQAVERLSRTPSESIALARAHLYLGIAYANLGQDEQARESLREALASDPKLEVAAADVPGKARRILQEELENRNRKRRGWGVWPYVLAGGGFVGATALARPSAETTTVQGPAGPANLCLSTPLVPIIIGIEATKFTVASNRAGNVRWDYGDGTMQMGTLTQGQFRNTGNDLCSEVANVSSTPDANRVTAYWLSSEHNYEREGDYNLSATLTDSEGKTATAYAAVHVRSLSGTWCTSSRGEAYRGVYYLTQNGPTITGYCSPCHSASSASIYARIEIVPTNTICPGTITWSQGAMNETGQLCGETDTITFPSFWLFKQSLFR